MPSTLEIHISAKLSLEACIVGDGKMPCAVTVRAPTEYLFWRVQKSDGSLTPLTPFRIVAGFEHFDFGQCQQAQAEI
jgi:hypothetical protein